MPCLYGRVHYDKPQRDYGYTSLSIFSYLTSWRQYKNNIINQQESMTVCSVSMQVVKKTKLSQAKDKKSKFI